MRDDKSSAVRMALITFFPMFIATLSLITSIFNGYLNSKFIDIIQRNMGRGEYMRTCKDVIDAYFQIKTRVTLMRDAANQSAAASPASPSPYLAEAVSAVGHFGALGTYLANLRDENIRARYSELTAKLDAIVREAATTSKDTGSLFAPADTIFAEMNDDCVKTAKDAPL
jgi:hypothetical protein